MTFLPSRFLFRRVVSNRAVLIPAQTAWSKYNILRTVCTQLLPAVAAPLLLKASEFQHLFQEGPTEAIYNNTPVRALGQQQQGELLQEWARRVLQEKNPQLAFSDPEPGIRQNGSRRPAHQSPYDFLMEGRRVEVKSARMVWEAANRCWMVRFRDIKLQSFAFDDLYLVLFSPEGLYLIKHDFTTGTSADGKLTHVRGHSIAVYGSRANTCWEEALQLLLQKLCEDGSCSLIATEPFSGPGFRSTLFGREPEHSEHYSRGQAALNGIPMSNMSYCIKREESVSRKSLWQWIARCILFASSA